MTMIMTINIAVMTTVTRSNIYHDCQRHWDVVILLMPVVAIASGLARLDLGHTYQAHALKVVDVTIIIVTSCMVPGEPMPASMGSSFR